MGIKPSVVLSDARFREETAGTFDLWAIISSALRVVRSFLGSCFLRLWSPTVSMVKSSVESLSAIGPLEEN